MLVISHLNDSIPQQTRDELTKKYSRHILLSSYFSYQVVRDEHELEAFLSFAPQILTIAEDYGEFSPALVAGINAQVEKDLRTKGVRLESDLMVEKHEESSVEQQENIPVEPQQQVDESIDQAFPSPLESVSEKEENTHVAFHAHRNDQSMLKSLWSNLVTYVKSLFFLEVYPDPEYSDSASLLSPSVHDRSLLSLQEISCESNHGKV